MISNVKLISISKLLFALYVFYESVLQYVISPITGLSYVLLFGAVMLLLIYNRRMIADRNAIMFLLFGVYVVTIGMLVAKDTNKVLTTAVHYFEYVIAFYLVGCYSREDKNIDFSVKTIILLGIIASLSQIFVGKSTIRQSIAENVNTNTTGIMITYALGFLLYYFIYIKKTRFRIILVSGIVLLFVFCIVQTGSKKGIITSGMLFLFWLWICYEEAFKKMNSMVRIIITITLIIGTYYAYKWYTTEYSDMYSYVQYRMENIGGLSTQERIHLIKEGFQIFLNHPLFGVGFNNARYYTYLSTYTHCFYTELLACTGIIGTLIFIIPMINVFAILMKKLNYDRYKNYRTENVKTKYLMVIYVMLLTMNLASIMLYMFSHFFAFSIINGYILISSDERTYLNQ